MSYHPLASKAGAAVQRASVVLLVGHCKTCNEAIDTKTVQKCKSTRSRQHLHCQHSQRQRPQFNNKKTLYFAATLLPKNSSSGPSIFIQAEIDEAIWAPDARHQSGEGNQGSHNAGFMMI